MRKLLWSIIVLRVFFHSGGLFTDDKWYFVGSSDGVRITGDTIFPIIEGDKLELRCEEDRQTCWYGRA